MVDVRASVVALGIVGACLALAGCPAPGEGPKAEAGYRAAKPVIRALGAYHAEKGAYPRTLQELVPKQLAEDPTRAGDVRFRYQRADGGYSLTFSYTGPGMNHCTYTPAQAKWQCHGYY